MIFGVNLKMGNDNADSFCEHVWRYEGFVKPEPYIKAIMVTLMLLGYDENWIYDELKPKLYSEMRRQRKKNGFKGKKV